MPSPLAVGMGILVLRPKIFFTIKLVLAELDFDQIFS
jgi:hypothetical protein